MIFDVRSHHYYENWRIAGGEHMPDATQFDPERLATQNITSVAFYCWNDPWESEPAAQWFAQQYGDQGVQVYDIKGLSYLDDVPGMCQYIDGDAQAIAQHSPHCAAEGGVGMRSGRNRCHYAKPPPTAGEQEPIVLDLKVVVAAILCVIGLVSMLIVGCYTCSRGGDAGVADKPGGKLDDLWVTQGKAVGNDFDDCELCKADFTGVVPAARMVAVPDRNYPPNLPGTPDSDADEASVGAHGLAVTRWESSDVSDEEPPRDETAQQERQGSPHSTTVADAPSERSP